MLRFDGYYIYFEGQEKLDDYLEYVSKKDTLFSFIRFFENGKVVNSSINARGHIKDIIEKVNNWLNESFSDQTGIYYLSNKNHISFDIISQYGVVEYFGVIESGDKIVLNTISRINGHTSDNKPYLFHPLEKRVDFIDIAEDIWNEYKH